MNKKFVTFLFFVVIGGAFLLTAVPQKIAEAGVLDDVLHFLKKVQNAASEHSTSSESQDKPTPPSQILYKPALDYEEAVIKAVDVASPSVVSIVVTKDLPVIEQCPYEPFSDLPPEFRDFFNFGFEFSQPCEKGTRREEVGGGSGFIVSEDGLILTNKHVVNDAKAEYTALTNDGKKYNAKVLARDPLQDLAVLKIDGSDFKPAQFGDSDTTKLGQTAIAIGNSLGEFRNTVSVGVISGLSRTITARGNGFGSETIQGVIQTDAAINPGNSGGPLLNLKGEVIGINTAIASGAQNVGFAIPINQAKRDIHSVKQTGSIKAPYLGVRYLMVTPDIAKQQNLSVDYGALVRGTTEGPGVMSNSPAAKAGVLAEDIILEINGEKLTSERPLGTVIQKYNIGETLFLKVQRGKSVITLNITLGERPDL